MKIKSKRAKFRVKFSKFTLPVTVAIFLVVSAAVVLTRANTQTNLYYGVKFPAGKSSFADAVVSYSPGIYLDNNRPNVTEPFNNPSTALGTPNSSNLDHPLPSISDRNDVALGFGGSITLQFTDNLLSGSGDSAPDLWIFEAGGVPESVLVEISKDGKLWEAVGQTDRKHSGIDLDAFGWGPQDYFSYVRLTDNPQKGDHDGVWEDGKWLGWGGANIDAVGAISSAALEQSIPNVVSSSFTVPKLILLTLTIFTAGLATGYFFKSKQQDKK